MTCDRPRLIRTSTALDRTEPFSSLRIIFSGQRSRGPRLPRASSYSKVDWTLPCEHLLPNHVAATVYTRAICIQSTAVSTSGVRSTRGIHAQTGQATDPQQVRGPPSGASTQERRIGPHRELHTSTPLVPPCRSTAYAPDRRIPAS